MTRTTHLLAGLALLGLLLGSTPTVHAGKGGNGGGGGKPPGGGGDPPAGSPEIAYFLSKGDKLMVMDADGANPTLVMRNVSGLGVQPSWSPDGTLLVFNATNNGAGIYVAPLSGGLTKLTSLSTQYVNRPVWSPFATADGDSKILFEDEASNGSRDLFLMNVDGSDRVNLTNTTGIDETNPSWNPTATKFAAVAGFNDGSGWGEDILVYDLGLVSGDLAITATTNLTTGTAIGHSDLAFIDWGRVNDEIAVSHYAAADNDWDIWVLDADGTGTPWNLTNTTGVWERQPAWSPDDSEIAYWHDGGKGARGVYVVSANGGTPVKLASDGRAPNWKR